MIKKRSVSVLFSLFSVMIVLSCSHSLKSKKQQDNFNLTKSKEKYTAVPENKLFASVDTTDEAVFTEAQLIESLLQKANKVLKQVYFEYNSFQLDQDAVELLVKIAEFLKENPGIRVLVQGHCDERGSSEYNMGLGENRAKVVKEYLINCGINSVRVEVTSYGKEKPVILNCTDQQCHSKNRRCEFVPLTR